MDSNRIESIFYARKTHNSSKQLLRWERCRFWFIVSIVLFICSSIRADWQPTKGPLMTRWAKQILPKKVHAEYPRPQMVRKNWLNLNGLWEYAIQPKDEPQPKNFDGQILVPFPAEFTKTIVPTSQKQGESWRYTTSEPGDGWQRAGFDDSAWQKGKGGFGTEETPGAVIGTDWNSSDIWLRRTFELENKKLSRPQLSIHHDEDAEVYINGLLVAKLEGYTSSYIRAGLDKKARKALKAGSNCLAVHCTQTTGGQYIDVGLVDVIEQ